MLTIGNKNQPQFGGTLPFSAVFEQNQVLNRQFIELGGYLPSDMLVARNRFERYEKLLDHGFWLGVAVTAPLLLGYVITRGLAKSFVKLGLPKLPKATIPNHLSKIERITTWVENLGKHSPLQIPFEWLDRSNSVVKSPEKLHRISQNLGLANTSILESYLANDHFIQKVRNGKLFILLVDLALMASSTQVKMWLKNALTASLSGKKGFSGTFNYTSEQYQKAKSSDYENHKHKRLLQSVSLAGISVIGLPLILWGLLKHPAKVGKGPIGTLKKLIPAFNYADVIFMSKWAFLWYSAFNYVLGGVLAARSSDERREHLIRALTLDFFYVVGDMLVGGIGALALQKGYKKRLQGVSLLKPKSTVPLAESLSTVFDQVNRNKNHFAYRCAQVNYWFGMVVTTLLLGLSIPLLNNYYTKQKVLKEQAKNPLLTTSNPIPALWTSPHKTFNVFVNNIWHQQHQFKLALSNYKQPIPTASNSKQALTF